MGFPGGGRNISETIHEVIVYFCVLQRFRRVRKITKTTIDFAMFVSPHETARLPLDGFS